MIVDILTKIKRRLLRVYHKVYDVDTSRYISKISRKAPWVFIAYIPDVFYYAKDASYLNEHQNRQEALAMVPILNKLGYNVFVQGFEEVDRLPDINVKIIFGHPPAIEVAAKKYKDAMVIMYATGAHYTHQNYQVKYITDYVNNKYGLTIPYRRIVPPYECHEKAQHILLIGSTSTIETFPVSVRSKITLIHQSIQNAPALSSIKYAPENEYFFMGSSGNLLRGVSFLSEYFSEHQDMVLNIVGPIEEFLSYIRPVLPRNIKIHGILGLGSDKMLNIMSRCNYVIYPTGSEGMPGSVLCSMKNGLIPLVTKWGAFDEIKDYGYLIDEWSAKGISDAVDWSLTISPEECQKLKLRCVEYSNNYSLTNFKKEFETYFRNLGFN